MYKISQRELLDESFWTKYQSAVESPLARGIAKPASWVGSVASVVAPEITEPLKKGAEWLKNTREKGNRAKMTRDQIADEYIKEDGFHPLKDEKITWNNRQNADGTINGTIKVGELIIDPTNGEPKLGRTFAPDKATYILKFDPKTRTAKRVRGPDRQLATSHQDVVDALEDAGYDVRKILNPSENTPGIIKGSARIRDVGGVKTIDFIYNRNTDSVQVI